MLFVYARHTPDCHHNGDTKYRRCRCPKWIDGYTNAKRVRRSAGTRSWEQAERKARLIEDAGNPSKVLGGDCSSLTFRYLLAMNARIRRADGLLRPP
jgi:hypothetical protein